MRMLMFDIAPSGWLQNKYLLIGALWSIFLFGVLHSKYLERMFENCNVLKWIGNISYELYLFHYLVLFELGKFLHNTFVKGLKTILISVLLSEAVGIINRKAMTHKKCS
jgi:peptidoglycan/LPS O-acetylase OafA/YrhL